LRAPEAVQESSRTSALAELRKGRNCLQFVKLTPSAGSERTIAIVAEFTGSVQVFDITEILQDPYVEKIDVDPDFVWYAPEDPLDRRRPNVFDADTGGEALT